MPNHDGKIDHDGTWYHDGTNEHRTREYRSEFDRPEMRFRNSSIDRRPDAVSSDYLTSFTLGPNDQGDVSGGMVDRLWRVRLEGNTIYVSRTNGSLRGEQRIVS
jgi:hypothetical protein